MTRSLFATMTFDHLQSLATAATRLNNVGITLMERGYTAQAVQVLHDATRTLQEKCGSDLPDQLDRAHHWVSCACSEPRRHIFMDVQTIEDADEVMKTDAAMYGPSSSVVFALQLRESSGCGSTTTSASATPNTLDYVTAIVMYNFALAHRCHYAATNSTLSLVWADTTLRAATALLRQASFRSSKAVFHRDLLLSMIGYSVERVLEELERDPQGPITANSPTILQDQQYLSSCFRLTETQAAGF